MKTLLYISLFIAATILIVSCEKSPKNYSPEQQAAIGSATAWVNLIDEGKYRESWQNASNSFKKDVTKRQWDIGLTYIRGPYGQVLSREVKSFSLSDYDSNLGKHRKAIIQFQTTLENQKTVTEFLTLQLVGSTWRVSTYYLDR